MNNNKMVVPGMATISTLFLGLIYGWSLFRTFCRGIQDMDSSTDVDDIHYIDDLLGRTHRGHLGKVFGVKAQEFHLLQHRFSSDSFFMVSTSN